MIIILPESLKTQIEPEVTDHIVTPSWLSPLTSMSVRYAIDSGSDTAITAFRIKDAMAAISARAIARRKPKITVRVIPNSQPPKGIPSDVKAGVDEWIFPSERMRSLYPRDIKGAKVSPPIDARFNVKPTFDPEAGRIIWIGEINANTDRLKKAINWVSSQAKDCTLEIFGEGKARYVMPAVRLARSVERPGRIQWRGRPFTAADCNDPITAVIQAGLDPTPLENRLKQDGIELLNID